jgi:oligopeptide/dipeptide ABC transporter ATP-binding protein
LLASIPRLGKKQERLHVITGTVPNPLAVPPGCAFRPRCPIKAPRSDRDIPALKPNGSTAEHLVACWQYE